MKSRYYKVGPSIWVEPWDDQQRLAALYLLTCPHRTTEGLFRLPLNYAATDLGWTTKRFAKAIGHLEHAGFVEHDKEAAVVLIVKALKWQAPQNPNQRKAAIKALADLPPTPLFRRFYELARLFAEPFAEELSEVFVGRLSEGFAHPPALAPTHSSSSVGGVHA